MFSIIEIIENINKNDQMCFKHTSHVGPATKITYNQMAYETIFHEKNHQTSFKKTKLLEKTFRGKTGTEIAWGGGLECWD